MASRERRLVRAFVELADTLEVDFDVSDYLQVLAGHCVELLGGDTAAIVLTDQRGELRVVTSTSHVAAELEEVALAQASGPCVEAVATGTPVVNVPARRARARWPGFTAAAAAAGLGSVSAFPLRLRTEVVGALSVGWRGVRRLDDDDVAVATALTRVATTSLLQERTVRQREVLAERLQSALNDRVTLEQAKGVLAAQAGVDVAIAFDLMRRYAGRTGTPLTRVAADVADQRIDARDLADG